MNDFPLSGWTKISILFFLKKILKLTKTTSNHSLLRRCGRKVFIFSFNKITTVFVFKKISKKDTFEYWDTKRGWKSLKITWLHLLTFLFRYINASERRDERRHKQDKMIMSTQRKTKLTLNWLFKIYSD